MTYQPPARGIRMLAGLLCLFLMITAAPLARAESLGVVTGGNLHLRETPHHDAHILATYKSGTHVTVLDESDIWYQVRMSDGKQGYMEKEYIYVTNRGRVENGNSYVNLRSQPSRDAKIIGQYDTGTMLTLLSENAAGWAYVDVDGTQGYMALQFIEPVQGEEAAPQPIATLVPENDAAVNPYGLSTNGDNNVVHQYGQGETEVGMEEAVAYTIYYPYLNLDAADAAIRTWIDETIASARQTAQEAENQVQIEITAQYDTYWVSGRYVGVLETGFIDSGMFAHPGDLIFTMNVDTQNGTLLSTGDILVPEYTEDFLAALEAKLSELEGNPVEGLEMDESWLDYLLLTSGGLSVVLPRGEYLPSVWGTQSVTFAYAELLEKGWLALPLQPETEHTEPAPTTAPQQGQGERTIDPTRPMIAITFDDGPGEYTTALLDVLTQYDAVATFYMVGNRINNYQDAVRQVVAQGSEIGTHTWSHKQLTKLAPDGIDSQLRRGMQAIENLTGQPVTTMRPPYGSWDSNVKSVSRKLGLTIVTWNVDTEDWKTNNADKTYDAIMRHVKNGSIILCHETKGSTVQAMKRAIPALLEKGYQLLTVSELLSFTQTHGEAGMVYNHLDTSHLEGGN